MIFDMVTSYVLDENMMFGKEIYQLAERLWPLNRSITGDGVRETLSIIKGLLPGLEVHEALEELKSPTQAAKIASAAA